ncbi:hypothetical protein AGMMS5026_10200 [Endomicrobiia bacterium]|nr:hypothetical protein AGMMS49523_01210 [Endomicrobiia bacterium]GHT10867.1 hypothetical protein AGMMS49571_00220 [Endomicrobiia bacterium]GHT21353.1 hypothetical protein AGMMS49929_09770 [Endomicrobiia bacterium]GHT25920.1 hypothetical protein AGMMS49995_01220 [Endomicrobiia bacterium]GHT32334.1 hypothetical protein AGMMS5026_10200 [Endomicrobiia bacterium]
MQQPKTLEIEIKDFVDRLPYWGKYLAKSVLSSNTATISDGDVETSYSYLLEELELKDKTEKPEIIININDPNSIIYKSDLYLTKLEQVEGVNALEENQIIEFNPHLTIIYGANGSGKSGYVRLFKKVFYSKMPEEILSNINIENRSKTINGKFTFHSDDTDISLTYKDKENAMFEQFSVFDDKGLIKQLDEKNELRFRPAGLNFFASYTEAIMKIEQKLNSDITKKSETTVKPILELFDDDSKIKSILQNLNPQTAINELKKYVPFSEEDKIEKSKIQEEYDELLLASKEKEKKIKELKRIRTFSDKKKQIIEDINHHFSVEMFDKVNKAINDCIEKEAVAKNERIKNFKVHKIEGLRTIEWRCFIESAKAFAIKHKPESGVYPESGDDCLLCQQPLSEEAKELISNYWTFIKSLAEENSRKAQEVLNKLKQKFEELEFDLFPDGTILTDWLTEKHPKELAALKQKLSEQKMLSQNIISAVQNKKKIKINAETRVIYPNSIEINIDAYVRSLEKDERNKKLDELKKLKIFFEHKEKLNNLFPEIEACIDNQVWIQKAEKTDFVYKKRQITCTEKRLSEKYFNKEYIDKFNAECKQLDGNFGISIDCIASAGKSYKQLKIKETDTSKVLSEGEQKVIAIADFLAEMQLSQVNKGVIFDDPVNSLDNERKKQVAERLANLSKSKQVIIFTHDLVFVSAILSQFENGNGNEDKEQYSCHWVENIGAVRLNNTPCHEKKYRNPTYPCKYHADSIKCGPEKREELLKHGFAALRTCYEVLVINDLFNNVVQRYSERVSIDSLSKVCLKGDLINELMYSYNKCCRYMEGHSHSDEYSYKKPEPENLKEEIEQYNKIKAKIKESKK